MRLLEDIKHNKNGKFITLTFSNEAVQKLSTYEKEFTDIETGRKFTIPINSLEGYELDNEIATVAMRLFNERWRKKYKTAIRHWMVTELGHNGTENIHLHGIIWTDESVQEIERIWNSGEYTNKATGKKEKLPYGYVWKGYKKNGKLMNYVNEATVNYCTKYVHKMDVKHKTYKSKILTSPGIGRNYTGTYNSTINKYNNKETDETYRTREGYKIALPVYWRNKIYSEQEREQLWIQKLDKQERWICGTRVDISKGEEDYYRLLEQHRKRNNQLGYGDGQINWSRKEYERQRRAIMHKARGISSATT